MNAFSGDYSAHGEHQRKKDGYYGKNMPQIEEKNSEEMYFINRRVDGNVNVASQVDQR